VGGPQLGPPGSLLWVQWTVRCDAGTPATGELTGCNDNSIVNKTAYK